MKTKTIVIAFTVVLAGCSGVGYSGSRPNLSQHPFGGESDVNYAQTLWKKMESSRLVGKNALLSTPYIGQPPHGAILDAVDTKLTVGSNSGELIIKRNYGGPTVSKENVANDPNKYLKAVTVMYRRSGYDPENKDWFWVKYSPDGNVLTNPKGMSLAGRVAKGMPKGCIACHTAAPGGDMVFNHDRFKY
jgi:hypothetical protein